MKMRRKKMIKRQSSLLFLFVGLSLSLLTCSTYKNLDRENLSVLYSPDNTLTSRYVVQHLDTSKTVVFYQFNFNDFLYKPKFRDSSTFYARYKLEYQLFEDFKASRLLDSSSMSFLDSLNYKKNNSTLGYFELKVPYGRVQYLRVVLSDLNAETEVVQLIEIDKSNTANAQNFIMYAADDLPVMNSSLSRNKDYFLIYNDTNISRLYVRYFKSFLKPAQPPMLDNGEKKITKIKTDSSYYLPLNKGQSSAMRFDKQGIYHFTLDSSSEVGYTVTVFTEGYPWITTPMQMAAPLRYLTTNNEYRKIIKAEDKKKAVDEFWLSLSSNPERAQSMLQRYYQRVQAANKLFASDREGWLTDRGMIYIVYGPPDRVFRNENLETWTYGGASRQGTTFIFYKTISPLSTNDYQLDRSPTYINSWNSTIEFWRR